MKSRLLFLILLAPPASAYQREDHAATVRLALRGFKGEALVAACAQLPDEAPELSAIDVYRRLMRHPWDYAQWAARGAGAPETAGRMAAVQQLLHGLTGGSSAGVRAAAREAVAATRREVENARAPQERADDLCALGFAYHLYGDSFAHSRLRNPARMYGTGIGHLFDSTRPDLPLVSPARLSLFSDYLQGAAGLWPGAPPEKVRSVLSAAEKHAAGARERNGFNEAPLRLLLSEAAGALAPFDPSKKPLGCQALIDAEAKAGGLSPAPSCERTWAAFRAAAEPAFDRYDAAHPDAPSRAPSRTAYYAGSPFDKGPQW